MSFKIKSMVSLLTLSSLFVTSCNKEDSFTQKALTQNEQIYPSSALPRSDEPCLKPFYDLFSTQLRHYRVSDPEPYFPEGVYTQMVNELAEERQKMDQMGFTWYVNKLEEKEKIATETKALLLHIHESVNVEDDVMINEMINDLVTNFNPELTEVSDPFYCYVYNIALEIYNNFYGGNMANPRGDCDFKDFVNHVIETASAGAGIGQILGNLLHDENGFFVINVIGVTIRVTGQIIGGAIGAIVGLFTHDSNGCEDCNPVVTIVTTSDDDCDLTRTLEAIGAGEDALAFEWRINQDGTTQTITTTTPFLTVTQIANDEPIGVSVASLCLPENETDPSNAELTPFTPTIDIDLSTDENSLLGQPGEIDIIAIGGFGNDVVNSNVGLITGFIWSNSNEGSGHIEHTFTTSPADLGNIVEEDGHIVKVQWTNSGSGYFRVDALNTCSGVSTFRSIQVNIN